MLFRSQHRQLLPLAQRVAYESRPAIGSLRRSSRAHIQSSRDIEGENPLYLPQAKIYDGSCALGPSVLIAEQPLPKSTAIVLSITRNGAVIFSGKTTLAELKREPRELANFLFRDNCFPAGAYLMTGTGIVPGDPFTLAHGDTIDIDIDGIGRLRNHVR